MSKLEEFYRALIKDPDLEIKAGQTREQAAQQEAEYRARQYHNNEQALSMATEPEKSALDSLFDFMAKEYRGVSDEGIKALHENLPNKFGPLKYEQIVDRVQTGKNKGEPKLKPNVKPDKQYRYNDKTGKLELFQPRAQAGTSNSPSDWKYKDSDTPSAESIKDFVDGLYGNLQDSGLSEEDVLNYIEQNINNPDWYNSKTEDGISQKEVIEDYIKRIGVAREEQRLQTSNIPERDNPPSARARALDKIKEAETGVTEEQPSNEKAREIQADTDNYNRIKDSLGNKNRKGTRAVWTTPRSSEKKIFDALPKEIQTVLNDIHSKGKGATRLTPAQQIHLLNKFNEENETSTHTDLYEGMRTDDDKGYNFRHDPSINPESYRDRLNQNKLKFNEDIKQDAMTAVNRFLQSDKNDLDLTDNQIKVLQDSVLEDNLNTILAPVVEAKSQNIKAPLKNPSDEVEKPEKPPSRAKFTKAAEKYFNRKGDELKDIIQTMTNSGLFDSTIPAKGGTKISGFKQETSENLIAMFENDTNPQFREVRDRLPQILDMTKKRRDPNGKVTTYKLSDLATKIDNEKAIEDSNNENLTQSDEEFEENIVENQKDNTDTSNEVQETIDTVSDKPDDETVNIGSAPTTTSDDDPAEESAAEETIADETPSESEAGDQDSDAEKIESLNLIRDGNNFREMDENGNPDKSKPIVREIEINGEKKYIASIKDGSDTIWYEHTEENMNSSQKGDEDSTGNTRKDLVAKLQEQADSKPADTAAETEAPAEAEEGGTTVETETEETSADGGSNETSTDTTESSTDEQVEGAGEVSAEGSGGEQVDGAAQSGTEGGGDDTPTIPPAIKSQLDKAEKDGLIRHAYEKELGLNKGEEDDFHKYEAYKKEFIEEYSDKPIEKLNKKLGQIGKSIRQIEAKAADAAKKADDKEKKDNLKIKQQEEKERLDRIRDEKNADEERENNIAYGNTEEAQQARDEAHATSGANLFTHFNDKGEVSHETHGEAIGDDSKHNHFDEHDKKESGSHPAHHHNKEIMDKNIPPALREIKEEEAKAATGGEPNEQIISKNRQFLQQKNQEGYVWNHNTNHWIHRENLSGLMGGHVGNNATLANGNHVGKNGKATFLDGSGNAAQGIFHLGSGYNVHKFGMGVTGKHLANAYNQGGQLKNHIKSGNLATKFSNSKGIYESSGIGAPKATAKSGADLRSLGRQGAESGFNVTPMVSSIRSFFGLEKGKLSNSALQQLVESYSGKNKKR